MFPLHSIKLFMSLSFLILSLGMVKSRTNRVPSGKDVKVQMNAPEVDISLVSRSTTFFLPDVMASIKPFILTSLFHWKPLSLLKEVPSKEMNDVSVSEARHQVVQPLSKRRVSTICRTSYNGIKAQSLLLHLVFSLLKLGVCEVSSFHLCMAGDQ